MKSMGLEPESVAGTLRILDLTVQRRQLRSGEASQDWLQVLKSKIEEARRGGVEAIALDSLEALASMAEFKDRRREVFRLFEFLRSLEITSFIVTERYELSYEGQVIKVYDVADFLSDGILEMTVRERESGDLQRALRIAKMRDRNHLTSLYFIYWDDGFKLTQALTGPPQSA